MGSLNSFHFGLEEAFIAQWLGIEQYGSAIQLVSAELYGVSFDTVSGILKGDDTYSDVHAKAVAAKIKIKFGFDRLAAYAIFSGDSVVSSVNSESIVFNNTNRPYFAICGRIDATELGGDVQIFIPKAKITGSIDFSAQFGAYLTPSMDAMAVKESNTYGIGRVIKHATAQAVTIPPT